MLSSITIGETNPIVYDISPAIGVGYVPASFSYTSTTPTSPTLVDRATRIRLRASDLQFYNEQNQLAQNIVGSGEVAEHIDLIRFNARNQVASSETRFYVGSNSAVNRDGQLLSQTIFTYDHVGQVKSSKLYDSYQDWTQSSLPNPLRETTFQYDYSIMPTYFGTTDPATSDGTPKYDQDDYRGNIVSMADHSGTIRYNYETDDELLAALGTPTDFFNQLGFVTRYEYDSSRRLTRLHRDRKNSVTGATETATEKWLYGASPDAKVQFFEDAFGLRTEYFYDNRRRIEATETLDAGFVPLAGGNRFDPEWTTVTYTYDTAGYPDLTTTEIDGQVISIVNEDHDSLGNLRKTVTTSSTGKILSQFETTYYSDGLPNLVSQLLDENGVNGTDRPHDSQTEYTYDKAGRLTQLVEAKASTYPVASDNGTAASIQQTTTYQYYADGSLKQVTKPDQSTIKSFYDPRVFTEWTSTSGVAGQINNLLFPQVDQDVIPVFRDHVVSE